MAQKFWGDLGSPFGLGLCRFHGWIAQDNPLGKLLASSHSLRGPHQVSFFSDAAHFIPSHGPGFLSGSLGHLCHNKLRLVQSWLYPHAASVSCSDSCGTIYFQLQVGRQLQVLVQISDWMPKWDAKKEPDAYVYMSTIEFGFWVCEAFIYTHMQSHAYICIYIYVYIYIYIMVYYPSSPCLNRAGVPPRSWKSWPWDVPRVASPGPAPGRG